MNARLPEKLRPVKWRNAITRRWFERRMERIPIEPYAAADTAPLVDVGTSYGGWLIPEGSGGAGWTCYCVGAGGDVAFDLELVDAGAEVRCFEPVIEFVEHARNEGEGVERFTVDQVAVTARNGSLRMQVNSHPGAKSVSSSGLFASGAGGWIEVPGKTLPTLMEQYGDDRIDLLKLDVEGGEYDLLESIDLSELGVRVFAVQLHHTGSVTRAKDLIERLGRQGFELVGRRPVVKLTFVRKEPSGP